MPARVTKKTGAALRSVAAGHRRSGRPRAATAASRIYSDLRTELVSLQRRPGEVISEAEIALSYGVSRTPVREAILKLSDEGLLEIFPQSGIFVSRIPIGALPEAIIIRKALEATTAQLAAERAPRPARFWFCIRSWSGSVRQTRPGTVTPFTKPMRCFTRQSRKSPDIPEFGR
jgi:biotin operon repressor